MQPEVPMASQFVLAHPGNYNILRAGGRTSYDLIIIHCTDGKSRALPVAEMFAKLDPDPRRHVSAHFVVDQDGTIIQCVPLRSSAKHAHDVSSRSIGIEHCARTPHEFERPPYNWDHDPGLPPSSAQYDASAKLVAYLLAAAGLPPDREHVKGHAEADKKTSHDRCPEGCGWNWDSYMVLVKEEYAKIVPPAPPTAA